MKCEMLQGGEIADWLLLLYYVHCEDGPRTILLVVLILAGTIRLLLFDII